MPREEVSFARGTKSTMPQAKVPGRLLIATDTGEAYVDDTTTSRVQLKDSTKVSKSGDTMNGVLNMSSHKITGIATPTADTDAANLGSVKSQVNAAIQNAQYTGTSPISVDNIAHTISHSNIGSAGSVGPTANSTASHGGTITVPYITVDAKGHVSAKANRTITLPAGPVNMRGASTSAAGAAGYAPAPSAGAANRYLRSDGTWAVPPDTNTTYSAFTGASSSAAGKSGLVPAPSTGYQNRYLAGDGTWKVIPDNNTTYSAGTGLTLSGTTFSLATSGVTAGGYGPTANVSGTDGTTIIVPQIRVDAYGRVTSVTNRVLTNKDTTYTATGGITLSGTQFKHTNSVTAGYRGPAGNGTLSPGLKFTVPQIYYDAYGHVTSSAVNRTLTLNSNILDTSDILTTLSGVTSNTKVLGAKLVADAINNLNSQVSTLIANRLRLANIDEHSTQQSISTGTTHITNSNHLRVTYGFTVLVCKITTGNVSGPGNQVILGWADGENSIITSTRVKCYPSTAAQSVEIQSIYVVNEESSVGQTVHPFIYSTIGLETVTIITRGAYVYHPI